MQGRQTDVAVTVGHGRIVRPPVSLLAQGDAVLLNIDLKHRTAIFHTHQGSCSHGRKTYGTRFKPAGHLGRDGGWFAAATMAEAQSIASREVPGYRVRECSFSESDHLG